jgi:hypothetical protein
MFIPAEPEEATVFNCLPTVAQTSPSPAADQDCVTSDTYLIQRLEAAQKPISG